MHPTKNTIQTPTTRTTAIASTSSAAGGIGIVNAHPSTEQIETVDIVVTYASQYASNIFPYSNQPCHNPIAIFDERNKPILHCCDVIANFHQHSTRMTQRVSVANNPIPAQAIQQMESINYEKTIVNEQSNLVGFMATQTSATLYENDAPAHAPREVEIGLHNFQEICTLQDDNHHIHSITRPVFIPFAQTPIPPGAFGFYWHLAYDTTSVEQAPPRLSVEQAPPRLSNDESYTASLVGSLPHRWRHMGKEDKKFYLDDIVQCFDNGATYNMIAKRHSITTRNVQQILVEEAQRKLRTIKQEREIALFYRLDRGNTLELPKLTRPPLRQFLEENFTPHQTRLNPSEQKRRSFGLKNLSYRIVQKKLKTNAAEHTTWCFPRNWELASDINKERYINDICECYEKKATYKMIAERHGIRVLAVRGILLLRYQNIRSPRDEEVLVLDDVGLKTKFLQSAHILKDLPKNLPPLRRYLSQLAEQKKVSQTDKTKQPAFTKPQQQTTEAPIRQDSSSPNFAGFSRTTTPPEKTTQGEDTP